MQKMVLRSKEMLESGDLDNFGKLLHENWQLKKKYFRRRI